jgi:hypothetical protein
LPDEIDTEELRREWTRFYKLPEYAALRPFLYKLEPFLNVEGTASIVKEGLALASELHRQGIKSRSALQDVAANFANQGLQANTLVQLSA